MSTAGRSSSIPDSTPLPHSAARCRTRTSPIAIGTTALGGTSSGQSTPHSPSTTLGAALAYSFDLVRRGQGERALPVLDAILQQRPDDVDALALRGRVLLQSGRREGARESFTRALSQTPRNTELRVWQLLSQLEPHEYGVLQRELAKLTSVA